MQGLRQGIWDHRIHIGAMAFIAVFWYAVFTTARRHDPGVLWIVLDLIAAVFAIITLSLLAVGGARLRDLTAALVYTLSVIVGSFMVLYWTSSAGHNFSERLTRLDALYFTVGTLTTSGTGNLYAVSQSARGLQTIQMAVDFIFIFFAIGAVAYRFANPWTTRKLQVKRTSSS